MYLISKLTFDTMNISIAFIVLIIFGSVAAEEDCGSRFGNRHRGSYIVNGSEAHTDEFPWQVSLQKETSRIFSSSVYYSVCGGAVISHSWVVTAAHCFRDRTDTKKEENPNDWLLQVGTTDISSRDRSHRWRVACIITHPQYKRFFWHDIALVQPSSRFEFVSRSVIPICIRNVVEQDIATDKCVLAGWGRLHKWHDEPVHMLRYANFSIMNRTSCEDKFRNYHMEDRLDKTICASGENVQPCDGDSGGALACPSKQDGRYYLIGVVAWTMHCGSLGWEGFPSGYEKVSENWEWIHEMTYKYG